MILMLFKSFSCARVCCRKHTKHGVSLLDFVMFGACWYSHYARLLRKVRGKARECRWYFLRGFTSLFLPFSTPCHSRRTWCGWFTHCVRASNTFGSLLFFLCPWILLSIGAMLLLNWRYDSVFRYMCITCWCILFFVLCCRFLSSSQMFVHLTRLHVFISFSSSLWKGDMVAVVSCVATVFFLFWYAISTLRSFECYAPVLQFDPLPTTLFVISMLISFIISMNIFA